MSSSLKRWRQGAGLSLALAAVMWGCLLAVVPVYTAAMGSATPLLTWLRAVWRSSEDMGHGPFLPLISLYVVFLRRREIAAAIGKPDGRGVALVLAGVLIFWIGLKTEDVRVCLAALSLWVWAVPFAVWGAGVARQLVFPAGFLLLCVPIDSLVIFFTMKLRLLAAVVAVGIANGIGIPTMRIGTGLHSTAGAGFNLDVAEACSGLRSIFAMTALSAAYAFFTQKTLWRQWLLFACAVPVAVAGNITRIVAITIVAAFFGEKTATGFYHDYSGYLVFLVAILLLMELGRLIGRWKLPPRLAWLDSPYRPEIVPPEARPFRIRDALRLAWPPLLLAGCVLMVRLEPAVQPGGLAFLKDPLPRELGPFRGSPLWHCHNEQCMQAFMESELEGKGVPLLPETAPATAPKEDWPPICDLQPRYRCPACGTGGLYAVSLGELKQLPGDTRLLRSRYSGVGPEIFTVTLVVSGTGRNSLHRPELCLPAQGFVMSRIRSAAVPGSDAMIKRVDLERTQGGAGNVTRLAFVYWFFSSERQTASHFSRVFWTAWDRAIHHRATRWVMVTITADQQADQANRPDQLLLFSGALVERLNRNNSL